MDVPRRTFLGLVPLSALSLQLSTRAAAADASSAAAPLMASPPVVQHPTADGFTVNFAVSALATGWVEWGRSAEQLDQRALAAQHGLVRASDQALSVRVRLDAPPAPGEMIFYRVAAQPLSYKNAYQLERGEVVHSPVYRLRLPSATAEQVTIAIVNDTHENQQTLAALHQRLAELAPDVVLWNGDTCNDFDAQDDPMQIVLNPGGDASRGWATEQPLLLVPGNHDVRGERARELSAGLSGWPGQTELPYNFAIRLGPIAIVGLDTGEDKPDEHPVFAGTAAYQPYRLQQAAWLKSAVERPEIAEAPIRFAFCHIPLRGRPGGNDGTTLKGYASYSGMGANEWMPILREARFAAVVSGHTHHHRIDDVTETESLMQIVGGGPQPERATLMTLRAEAGKAELNVTDLEGNSISRREWTTTA